MGQMSAVPSTVCTKAEHKAGWCRTPKLTSRCYLEEKRSWALGSWSSWAEPRVFCFLFTLQAAAWAGVMHPPHQEPRQGWLLAGWSRAVSCDPFPMHERELGDTYASAWCDPLLHLCTCTSRVRGSEYKLVYRLKPTLGSLFTHAQSISECNKTAGDRKIHCLTQTWVLSGSGLVFLFYFPECIWFFLPHCNLMLAWDLPDSTHFIISW